jgi:hypothetical protein
MDRSRASQASASDTLTSIDHLQSDIDEVQRSGDRAAQDPVVNGPGAAGNDLLGHFGNGLNELAQARPGVDAAAPYPSPCAAPAPCPSGSIPLLEDGAAAAPSIWPRLWIWAALGLVGLSAIAARLLLRAVKRVAVVRGPLMKGRLDAGA